jgi:hypothetical protein
LVIGLSFKQISHQFPRRLVRDQFVTSSARPGKKRRVKTGGSFGTGSPQPGVTRADSTTQSASSFSPDFFHRDRPSPSSPVTAGGDNLQRRLRQAVKLAWNQPVGVMPGS